MNLPKNEYRISITSACNMKCVYCHNEGNINYNQLTKNDIKKIVDNSYSLNLTHMRLTGGEPLIHPEIYDICKMLSEDYKLKVGINTNCIEIEKLLYMINHGWIDRVIVGLDYYDRLVSKQSPVGLSSKEILNNILQIKKTGCDISISTVYNNDYSNIYKLVKWSLNNKIRIKIIEEIENKVYEQSSEEYLRMRDKIFHDFNLKLVIDGLEEYNGYLDDFKAVSFFPSLCRLRRCDLCKKIHIRITSEGKIKQCIHYSDEDKSVIGEDCRKNILEAIEKEVNYHM